LDEVRHCKLCGVALTAENSYKSTGLRCKVCKKASISDEQAMYAAARSRASKGGYPFTISLSDISIPSTCPVLGITLKRHKGTRSGPSDTAPSLDKMVPSLGYVPGNIRVISMRANRIKTDATADELRAVLRYMEGVQ
jgi:hypothetical protein